MYSEDLSHIIGRAETDLGQDQQNTAKSRELGKDSFLKLLVTQLENQDPLDPKNDTEFIAQLAQFSSLEQLTSINDGISRFDQIFGRQDMLDAVSFIGKEVLVSGSSLSKTGEGVSALNYSIGEPATNCFANIFDSGGNLVRTVHFGARQAGSYQFVWDGKDYAGNMLQEGIYSVAMAAEGLNGEPVLVDTEVSGLVAGVNSNNGQTYLRLRDGREVPFIEVKEIISPEVVSGGTQEG